MTPNPDAWIETLSNQTFHQNHQNIKFFSIFKIPFLIRLGGAHYDIIILDWVVSKYKTLRKIELFGQSSRSDLTTEPNYNLLEFSVVFSTFLRSRSTFDYDLTIKMIAEKQKIYWYINRKKWIFDQKIIESPLWSSL